MTETTSPDPLRVLWSPEARLDLRGIDRATALEILHCIDHFRATHAGDLKKLKPPLTGFRLRCGDYRVFFDFQSGNEIKINAVRHRKQAYRR